MARAKWLLISIVLTAFVVRLIGIDQPFIDPWSWRQSDVAAIARNFLENGFHFTRPQIDWAGNERGFVGTEFPILPFVAALLYKSVGVQEWIGRIQGVLFFVLALPFFFGLVRKIFGDVIALWATFFYAFAPLSIVASRAFMPDVPSLSLGIIGTYFFLRWIEEERFRWLEQLGRVPADADSTEWELAQRATWWGKRIDPSQFWSGRTLWCDSSARQ